MTWVVRSARWSLFWVVGGDGSLHCETAHCWEVFRRTSGHGQGLLRLGGSVLGYSGFEDKFRLEHTFSGRLSQCKAVSTLS